MGTIWIPGMDTISNIDMGYGKSTCPILFVNQLGSENYKRGGARRIKNLI